VGQALFTWHAPELWARFTITLRRLVRKESRTLGEAADAVRLSFVKIVEMQRRGVPHFHFVASLDDGHTPVADTPAPPNTALSASALARLVEVAAELAHLEVPSIGGAFVRLRFGDQVDSQQISESNVDESRRVAGYLAKYVTKSVSDSGLKSRRVAPHLIDLLDVSDHTKRLLRTVVRLSEEADRAEMANWLHTLGYRGHVTSKSRQYSTTMRELRATRAEFQRSTADPDDDSTMSHPEWEFTKSGHSTLGERYLATSQSLRERESRWARKQLIDAREEQP